MRAPAAIVLLTALGGCAHQVALDPRSLPDAQDVRGDQTPRDAAETLRGELQAERQAVARAMATATGEERERLKKRLEALDYALERLDDVAGKRVDVEPPEEVEEIEEDDLPKPETLDEKELTEQTAQETTPKEQAPAKRAMDKLSCHPGDPLCSDLDGRDTRRDKTGRHAARVADDGAPPQGVLRVVRRHYPRMERCVPASDRGQSRQLNVQMMVDARGSFRQVQVRAGDLSRAVTSCIEDVFYAMRVPSYGGDERLVSLPLWIRRRP